MNSETEIILKSLLWRTIQELIPQDDFLCIIHPSIWNGYWSLKFRGRKWLRWLGRVFNSRRIYWLGLPIYWVTGLKEWHESTSGAITPDETEQTLATSAGAEEIGKNAESYSNELLERRSGMD